MMAFTWARDSSGTWHKSAHSDSHVTGLCRYRFRSTQTSLEQPPEKHVCYECRQRIDQLAMQQPRPVAA